MPPASRTAGGLPRASRRTVLGDEGRACLVVAKGEVQSDEDPLEAAYREFLEETGITLAGPVVPLAPVRQAGGKWVHVWAIEADIDASAIRSNTFSLEWPPRSGRIRQFPEVDRAAWFDVAEALGKIHRGQVALLCELDLKIRA